MGAGRMDKNFGAPRKKNDLLQRGEYPMAWIEKNIPRILIAGTASGCGKTTAVCAVLELLKRKGYHPVSLKCGPDYIDPMFHRTVTETDSANLDPFFFDDNTMNMMLSENAEHHDIAVIEGVMGFYDGTGKTGTENSTYEVARRTGTPVILVMDGRGAAVSILASLKGFLEFMPENRIAGVLFGQVTEGTYRMLSRLVKQYFGDKIQVFGYLPKLADELMLGSRHLGLITAAEIENLREKLKKTADILSETIDISALLTLSEKACHVRYQPLIIPFRSTAKEHPRIAVAYDKAFCFYYGDNFRLLRKLGAELVFFSPLEDEKMPADCDGLYLGGGYPELYKKKLSENDTMRSSVKAAVLSGMPCIAECGGFLYLGEQLDGIPMVGALPSSGINTGHLVRFGYVTLTARRDGLLLCAGESIRAHEFHYYDSTENGDGFYAEKQNGTAWNCVMTGKNLYAGYPHLHFYSNPKTAKRFLAACERYRKEKEGEKSDDFA